MNPQWIVFGVLALALALFMLGRWRYDIVALLALLVVTVSGIVPAERAFAGFGHPAVVTVAAILVVSQGLQNAGVVDVIARAVGRLGGGFLVQLAALCGLVALASGFMNNVGALALLMPVAIHSARRSGISPSRLLMPLAFASLLGGMTTLIGTPPNIIVAAFRAQTGAEPFRMFDFTPVGLGVALVGLAFMTLVGWRLIPRRKGQAAAAELFEVEEYVSEVRIAEGSPVAGKRLRALKELAEDRLAVVGLVRGKRRTPSPAHQTVLRAGDVLIVRAAPEDLESLVGAAGLELVGSAPLEQADLESEEVTLIEGVVMPDGRLEGQSAAGLRLRQRHGVNLLAIARQGARLSARLDHIRLKAGDVVLLQGPNEALPDVLSALGCLPLAARGLRLGRPRRVLLALGVFGAALLAAALGLLPVQLAFIGAAVAMVLAGLISLRQVYESVDWPVIVLLGGMIPVGEALETTGGAQAIAEALLGLSDQMPPAATPAVVLVGTMFLSDLVNNAAAVVLIAPIALSIAGGLGVSADPFLMAVAIGASCAFLTPIGHQSNTLVMGPGGYRFGDYWRVGLPLEALIVVVALPLILWVWPL